jgi:hypothetical protein
VREDLKRRLREMIRRGHRPGDRLPSVRQLSRRFGVAHGTAYQAIRELHQEGVIELRARRGAFVSARGALLAPSRSRARLDCVHAHLPLGNGFIAPMYEAFVHRIGLHGLRVEPVLSAEGQSLVVESTAAVLFNPPRRGLSFSASLRALAIVSTSEDLPAGLPSSCFDVVSLDQELGGRLAGHALRAAGCQDVFFVGVSRADRNDPRGYCPTCSKRLAGFEGGWGSTVPARQMNHQPAYGVPNGMDAFEAYARLSKRPRGVFCTTDELAGGFVLRARTHGLVLGRDYVLYGFDGQARVESMLGFQFPTVLVPTRQMGARAADLLVERIADPEHPVRRLLLGCTLRTQAGPLAGAVRARA